MVKTEDIEWDEEYDDKLTPYQKFHNRNIAINKIKTIKEDLPLLISQQGEIVCIEKSKDIPNIGVVGMRRTAKTLTSFGILDRIFHSRKDINIAIVNDGQFESLTHSFRNNSPMMLTKLKILEEIPRPLPLVYLFPSLADSYIPQQYGGTFKIAIPFKDFFDQLHFFRHFGKLGQSENYFKDLGDQLKNAKNAGECLEIVDNIKEKGSKNKIFVFLKNLLDEKLFDISADEQPLLDNRKSLVTIKIKNKITKEEIILDPFLGFLYMGLIPSLMTHDMQVKPYGPDVFTYYLRKIFKSQEPDGLFGKTNKIVCVFVDELEAIQTEENSEILARCVTEGAHRRIMLNWSTQHFSKVNFRLRTNTKFLISLRQTAEEAKEIARSFSLGHVEEEQLQNLKKEDFEAMVMGRERLKLYNPRTGKITYAEEGTAIKGTILFPLSRPKLPTENPRSSDLYACKMLKKQGWFAYDSKTNERILRMDQKSPMSKVNEPSYPILHSDVDLQKRFFFRKMGQNQMLSYQDIQRLGFCILSVPVLGQGWFPGQTVLYVLWKEGKAVPPQATILNFIPNDAKVIYDPTENRLRMWGRNAGPKSVGPWESLTQG